MHSKAILACSLLSMSYAAAADATGKLGDALVTEGNPLGVVYEAELLDKDSTNVRGSIRGVAGPGGKGVKFDVDFHGFLEGEGPYTYHIHDQPVPEDGNCTKTLAHLDPFIRGEDPACDKTKPETCQVGDNSGKHGKIEGTSLKQSYIDNYLATKPGIGAFFGNRSVVVHFPNKTRINCANFVRKNGTQPGPTGTAGPTGGPTGTGSGGLPGPTGVEPPPFEGSAAKVSALSATGILAVVVGLFW